MNNEADVNIARWRLYFHYHDVLRYGLPQKLEGRRFLMRFFDLSLSKYALVPLDGKLYYLHRVIWIWFYGHTGKVIQHIDRDLENNLIENLEAVDKPFMLTPAAS